MVIVTPGSAAPLLSLTVPSIVPLIAVDCADAAAAAAPSSRSVASTRMDHTRVMNAVPPQEYARRPPSDEAGPYQESMTLSIECELQFRCPRSAHPNPQRGSLCGCGF